MMRRWLKGALYAVGFTALAGAGLAVRHAQETKALAAFDAARAAAATRAGAGGKDRGAAKAQDGAPAANYAAALTDVVKHRKLAEVMADAAPGSWSRRATAASYELGYAQLSGDYEGYIAADRSLDEAFRVARSSIDSDAVGPLLLKAQLSYELHRLDASLESLRVPEKQAEFFHDAKLRSEIESLRGAVIFALGRYDEGLAILRTSVKENPSPGHKQRLALALAKVGADEEATRLFDETEPKTHAPRGRAWLELQRGKMAKERGRRVDARRHFELARALFPGFWQIEEQLAELDADEGDVERATAAYRGLVARTGNPEFMDALARLIGDREPEEAEKLRAQSDAIYEDRLARLPEASYGHALEHFLRMVPDPARAVEIAERNRKLRPNGEARTRLAQAYLRAGRLAEAREEMRKVLASPWVSAESYATAALVLRISSERGADEVAAKALAINPHALEELGWLRPS